MASRVFEANDGMYVCSILQHEATVHHVPITPKYRHDDSDNRISAIIIGSVVPQDGMPPGVITSVKCPVTITVCSLSRAGKLIGPGP